jgi:hypothetical protein
MHHRARASEALVLPGAGSRSNLVRIFDCRWDGDTLIVETNGLNDHGWLDQAGHPRSEKLHVTERLRRVDFEHIQFQITFDDPVLMTRPLTIALGMTYAADTDMLEGICNENEKDRTHFVAAELELKPKTQLSAAVRWHLMVREKDQVSFHLTC